MKRDAVVLELRVLGGRHSGACVTAEDGMQLDADDGADVMLTDLAADDGPLRLHIPDRSRWLLWPANHEPDAAALSQAPRIGEVRYFGGLPLCVSEIHDDWQTVAVPQTEPDHHMAAGATGALNPVRSSTSRMLRRLQLCVLTLAGIGVVVVLVKLRTPDRADSVEAAVRHPQKEGEPIDLTDSARRQASRIQALVQHADPALSLRYTPLRDGHVRVTGWVDSVEQLDRIDGMLDGEQPRPQVRLTVLQELREELHAQLGDTYPSLDVAPDGPARLKVSGLVTTEAERDAAMAAVRGQVAEDVDVESELRIASPRLPMEIAEAFTAAGFPGAHASWSSGTYVVTVSVPAEERPRFERSLFELTKRFAGVPLRIKPDFVQVAAVRSPAPFRISGVMGGAFPYIVLPDGSKLLPGGRHMGWRLQAIEPEVLIFDSPRRLVVAR